VNGIQHLTGMHTTKQSEVSLETPGYVENGDSDSEKQMLNSGDRFDANLKQSQQAERLRS